MRRIVRYSVFVLSLIALLVVAGACGATWSRAYVRIKQDDEQITLFMSHRGQMQWFSYRVFDTPWKIRNLTPGPDRRSIQIDLSGPNGFTSSAGTGAQVISSSGAWMTVPLANGFLPHWWSQTSGRISSGSNFPDSPAQRMKQAQIPYWPALALALLLMLWSGRFVFRDLRSRRRVKAGLCANCAYDLRASPDNCPECGLSVPARA